MDCCHLKISSTSYFSPSFHVESTTPTGFVSLITHHVYLSPPWKVLEILATLASSHGNVFRQSLVRRKYRYERRTECFSLINRQFEEFYKNKGWYNWINFMPFLLSKILPLTPLRTVLWFIVSRSHVVNMADEIRFCVVRCIYSDFE